MYVVYGLEDPRDNRIYYVGMTGDIYKRFIQHINCEGDNREKNMWIDGLKAEGLLPIPRTLEKIYALSDARIQEGYWIKHYTRLGMPLKNAVCIGKRNGKPIVSTIEAKVSASVPGISSEAKEKIISIAQMQLKMHGRIKRNEIPALMGKNNRYYPIVKQVLDEEGL